jgi:hypothetical protein
MKPSFGNEEPDTGDEALLCDVFLSHSAKARGLVCAGSRFQLGILKQGRAVKSPFDAIRELMAPPAKPRREIGFHAIGKEAADGGATKAKRK